MDPLLFSVIFAVVVGVVVAYLIFSSASKPVSDTNSNDTEDNAGKSTKDAQQQQVEQQTKKKQAKSEKSKRSALSASFSHPWLVATLKGHAGTVTSFDVSPNGKYLVSCATDRALFLWSLKDITNKEHKHTRCNVEFDCATLVKFSPDSRSFITSLENGNTVRVFKFGKKDDGSLGNIQAALDDFPKTMSSDIISIGIDTVGHYVMTCDQTTKVDIFSIKGEKYHNIDTGTMKNFCGVVSPCGRFVAVSGFVSDAKVWEVMFDKAEQFSGVRRAFDLKGHSASVLSLAFSSDSSRMATISKDGTWKLWNTEIEYVQGQDPKLLKTGTHDGGEKARVSLSPDGRTVAIAANNNLILYNGITEEKDMEIKDIFQGAIQHLTFSVDGKYVMCCGDRQICIFNNVTGYRSTIYDMKDKLISCNKNMERRLNEQLDEARKALKIIGFDE